MKRIFFTLSALLIICGCIYAQPPQGGRGGNRGGRPGGPPPRGQHDNRTNKGEVWLENMPQIPNITLEQREKLSSILKKEHDEIKTELAKKRKIQMTFEKDKKLSQKQIDKNLKEMDKIDDKIHKIKDKSNKKVKNILKEDGQYEAFISKRDEIKFREHKGMQRPPRDSDGNRPSPPNRRNEQPESEANFNFE